MSENAEDNFDDGLMNMLDMGFDGDENGNPLPEIDEDGSEVEPDDEESRPRTCLMCHDHF